MSIPPAIFTQIGQAIFGLSIILSVLLFLNSSEQVTLFLFLSLGALSRLADMGFLNLVIIYSSKSCEDQYEDYLPALKIYTFKQHIRKLVSIFPLIFLIGCFVFFYRDDFSNYIIAWIVYVLAISSTFSINYFLSFHEGAYDLKFAHISRGIYFSISGLSFLLFSYFNFSILSLGLSLVISSGLIFIFLFYRGVLKFESVSELTVSSFHDDFIHLSHKTFFSWLGGYIGTHGLITASYLLVNPVFSGLLGFTFNIFIFLQNLANTFLVSVIPRVSSLASTNAQRSLRIIMVSLRKSLITFLILSTVFFVFYLNLPTEYSDKLLGFENILFIASAFLGSIVTYALFIFIRAFKIEPFGVMSLVTSFIAVATLTLIASFSLNYALAGFALSSCISLLWTYVLYLKYKQYYA